MQVNAQQVQELRSRTGAGIMDCKKALAEENGDIDKAIEYLRKKGLSAAAKKAGRIASEGVVSSYIHGGGKIGVLLEVNCETDFVGKNDDFVNFAREVALQIAAMKPEYVSKEEVPADVIERERGIRIEQAKAGGKPEQVAAK